MEISLVRYIAMALDCFSALILTLILVCCVLEKNKMPLLKIYICMAASCVFSLIFEAVSYMVSFFDAECFNTIRVVLCTVAIIGGYSLAFFYARYVANLVGYEHKLCKITVKILRIIGVAFAAVLVIGKYFGLFFTIQNGIFVPGKFFTAIFLFDIIACLTGIFLIANYGKKLNTKDIIALFSLPVVIFASGLLQYTSFGLMFGLFLTCAISLFIIYLMIQQDRNHQKIEQEKQLMDMNIIMMRSQIKPHFLYNSLSSIRRMIKKDPDVAEAAVENFSLYLRQNLEAMNQTEPISFTEELKHVKEYLYLEKLRFGDRLRIEYDISFSEFALPVLTLQPIVENAVKHGVLKKEDGGCVKISAKRDGGVVILTVSDDGVGFIREKAMINDSSKLHVGFENVKNRIMMQCKGTINIESEIGLGTTVTMLIPIV